MLTVIGGICLLIGLLLALKANRAEAQAIRAIRIGKGIYGNAVDQGWLEREAQLRRSDQRFRLGVWLTLAGVILQTIGAILD